MCAQLHKNYPFSIGKGSKHANARNLFVVDKMEKKEVKVACFPIDDMIADYSTKSTQGCLFLFQRNTILGVKKEYFSERKLWRKDVLKKYDLWDNAKKELESL